jgi:hypothetical protein
MATSLLEDAMERSIAWFLYPRAMGTGEMYGRKIFQ